jgi:hypothetical protein
LYAANGRRIPLSANSPTGSTFTACSTFVSTRGLIRIWLGFVTQPRGNVGYRANSRIVKPALEPDCAERSEAVRNPDAEANVVPEPTPPIGKFKFREAEAGRDLSARSRQLQLTFGTKYVAMEARYPLASARRDI